MSESQNYQNMLTEVEKIVEDVSSSELDLDDMVSNVKRGYQLIQTMKLRLSETKMMIEDLHKQHEESENS